MNLRDLIIPALVILAIFLFIALAFVFRIRNRVLAATAAKKAEEESSGSAAELRDKKKLREIELQRQTFVVERYVQDGVQDHAFFRRKKKLAEEDERYLGRNNMFYVDQEAMKRPNATAPGSKGNESSLALVFGFCEVDGSAVCEEEAERVKETLEKIGYRVCCFSHDGRNAPPSSAVIAKTLKHLQLSRRRWQSVIVYICGAARSVNIPSLASSGVMLESDIGKKIAAKERMVPTMWEMLSDSRASQSDPKSWLDLTTLVFRVRQVASTTQPVAVFLDISVAPNVASAADTSSNSNKKNDGGIKSGDDSAMRAALVRASLQAAAANGRDELQAILPPQLLQQIEIVYSRRERPPPGAPTKRSYFNQAFVRGCGGPAAGAAKGGAASKEDQLNAMLQSAGIGGLATPRMLGNPTCGLESDARLCGAITSETIAVFAEKTLGFYSKNQILQQEEDDEDSNHNVDPSEQQQISQAQRNNIEKKVIHIAPYPGSCELHLQPVYGPRSGFRPDLLIGDAHRQTVERAAQLWTILADHFNLAGANKNNNNNSIPAPAVVRGFATTTTLKYLTWASDVLHTFPDSVVYVDVSNYSLRHTCPINGDAAREIMWRTALQVVSNSYLSYNRTWPRIADCAVTIEGALVAAASENSRRFLLVFDNVPDFQDAASASVSDEQRRAAVADSGYLLHAEVYKLVARLASQHGIELCVVVGTSSSSAMASIAASKTAPGGAIVNTSRNDGYVSWMASVPPVSALQPRKAGSVASDDPAMTALAVELSITAAESATRLLSLPGAKKAAPTAAAAAAAAADNSAAAINPTAWELAACSSLTPSRNQQNKRKAASVADVLASLDLAHRNLLELVNFMQRDLQNTPVPVELVSHYAELHCAKSIDAACRATGLSLLAQKGVLRRTALIQPRGLETECVFVNPAVRKFLINSASSAADNKKKKTTETTEGGGGGDEEDEEEIVTRNFTRGLEETRLVPIKLPRSGLEGHVWRVCVCFAQMPQLKDHEQMHITSGAALFHETARNYFPRFLISLAHLSVTSHDTLRSFPAASEMGITPERCDVVLQSFLNSPQVYGDLVTTMGIAATSTVVEATAAITAGQGGASKQLRQAAAAKIVTTMRTIGDFLDNNPHEWAFQLCHRGVRGFYNNSSGLTFARVPAHGMKNPGDMAGLAVPVVTCSSSVNKSSNVNKYATVLSDAPVRKSKEKATAATTTSSSSSQQQQQQQHEERYPTAIEYAPLNSFPEEIRGLVVVGFSDGSLAVYRPAAAGNATATEVAPWPEALFEVENEKGHGLANPVTNILFEIDENDKKAEQRKLKSKKEQQQDHEEEQDDENAEAADNNNNEDGDDLEKNKPRQNTRIITASRSNGNIYRWSFSLNHREDIGRISPEMSANISRCHAPFYARILRYCTDGERLAHERLGYLGRNPAAEEDADAEDEDDVNGSNNNNKKKKPKASALDSAHRRTTHTTFESGGEVVALMAGQEHDGDTNQVILTLTEVRQCIASMTFDVDPITRPAEWKDDGLVTAATVGVDAGQGCVLVCVGNRSGWIMQFELRFYYEKPGEDEEEEEAPRKQPQPQQRATSKTETTQAVSAAAPAPASAAKSVADLE